MKRSLVFSLLFFISHFTLIAGIQPERLYYGKSLPLMGFFSEKSENTELEWIDVNTSPETWHVKGDELICSGKPTGVMRSARQFENFMLHVEWKHIHPGGNSGVFVWSSAVIPSNAELPDGVEVQMLDAEWVNQNSRGGVLPPVAYVNGELFGVGGVKTIPDNPRGNRSRSTENRCKPAGEWNSYDVVCVDGTIKLSVNGRFVNGISKSSQKKGYICLESEGSEIHFRNLRIIELPGESAEKITPASYDPPLGLHPENPHYFLFRGKPVILIGSTEHYGAVMNLDFDFNTYFDELAAFGLNVTRTFTGIYVEPRGAFNIFKNTMAPDQGRFICPWARSNEPGYANGGNKFDLGKWDPLYFSRLKDFVAAAGRRDIVVELDLFSNFYDTVQWKLSPLNYRNNINNVPEIDNWKDVLSLKNPSLVQIQEAMVRKIIYELRDFDNLYYEICNEPYFGDTLALQEWEKHMTSVVIDAEKAYAVKHLISNNIQNEYKLVPEPRSGVSVYNFHYAAPPHAVRANYHLQSVIGDNETGFDGIGDAAYRKEAWGFILSGGGLYNNLDYSFTTDNEDGTYVVTKGQPGGGGRSLRDQLKLLTDFMKGLDYIHMKPMTDEEIRVTSYGNASVHGLGNENVKAFYVIRKIGINSNAEIEIKLESGSYDLTILDPVSSETRISQVENHPGGWLKFDIDSCTEDMAFRIDKRSE